MKRGHIFALCFLLSASFGYCSENRYSEIAKKVADEMSQPEKTYTITERELESLIKGERDLSEILNIGSQIKQREQDKIEKERKEEINQEWNQLNEAIKAWGWNEGYGSDYYNVKKMLIKIEARDKRNEDNLREYQKIK